jgi:hypothetical protein
MDFVSTLVRLFDGLGSPEGLSFKYGDRSYPIEEVGADFIKYRTDYNVEVLYAKATSYRYYIRGVRIRGSSLIHGKRRIVIDIGSG